MKKTISLLLILAMLLAILPGAASAAVTVEGQPMEGIGIGGGGALCTPLIDPTDPNRFYVTCDMGGLYCSYDRGQSWFRTESKGWLRRACITEDGTIFTGGYGLYVSKDHGKTLEMIYPKDPDYIVSRCGWHEYLMLADDFDNGYLSGVTATNDKVFFATTSWAGSFRLMYADHDGSNLKIFYSETLEGIAYDAVKVMMDVRGDDVYYTYKDILWKYNVPTDTITQLYVGEGTLKDVEWIGDQFFLLDDAADATRILYTSDFENWSDLMELNDLPTTFVQWGETKTFTWHFKEIVGNNFDNIFLSFSCDVSDGIMKFNGTSFEWVFDSMYKTRNTIVDDGWSYGSHGPFYGICTDPYDDDFCVVATETLYTIHYANAEDRQVNTTHCTMNESGAYTTTGLNVQTTYSVREDPFDPNHIIICSTDLGLQNSYDNGQSFKRMEITGGNWYIFNTCYDLRFDPRTEGLVYGLWSNRHDAPNTPSTYDTDWTEGKFGVSRDGGNTWDFSYSTGLPADCIPVKMSVLDNGTELTIAVATFNRGFYISYDSGRTFVSLNEGMEYVEGLIWGEDIVLTEDRIYCLVSPYNCVSGYWEPAVLYDIDRSTGAVRKVDLGELVLVRSLTYHETKGLYLNVIPSYEYGWFMELNNGFWVNKNGGIYHYDGNSVSCVFECYNGIYNSGFAPDGTMYAVEPYGRVYAGTDGELSLFADNLFNQLKNVSFSSDGDTLYITTFGGGVYRTAIPAPAVPEIPEEPEVPEEVCAHSRGYQSLGDGTHMAFCALCGEDLETAACTDEDGNGLCDRCWYAFPEPECSHSSGYRSLGDGTHQVFCILCGEEQETAVCTDSDGRCALCGYVFPKPTVYNQKSYATEGASYLITIGGKALGKDLSAASVGLSGKYGLYTLSDPEQEVTHWTYSGGKLSCEADGTVYYLSLNGSKKLCVTEDGSSAVTWTVSNGRISTTGQTLLFGRKTTYYLNTSGSSFTISTRKGSVTIYEAT